MVDEFIEAVLGEWACDMGDVERNVLGVALRSEVETRLVLGLPAVHALFLGADARALGRIPEWLDRVQIQLPSDAGFFTNMGRRLDPVGSSFVEENAGLLPGESEASRTFTDCLWSMTPSVTGSPLGP